LLGLTDAAEPGPEGATNDSAEADVASFSVVAGNDEAGPGIEDENLAETDFASASDVAKDDEATKAQLAAECVEGEIALEADGVAGAGGVPRAAYDFSADVTAELDAAEAGTDDASFALPSPKRYRT